MMGKHCGRKDGMGGKLLAGGISTREAGVMEKAGQSVAEGFLMLGSHKIHG